MVGIVGWPAHERGLGRLRASYTALPADATVRLAKRTSNLFRRRDPVAPGPSSEHHPRSRRTASAGLDVSGLTGVIEVDPRSGTAEVQGMCTYEDLVDATLPHGLVPLVVPQLRTITLGGAVTGLGIESTSFRHGLPHESVLEMDVFTGAGEVVSVKPGDDLFDAFPNSYGSLGYATRLRIELEPVATRVALRHVRFGSGADLAAAIEQICATRAWAGQRVDGLDGVVFGPGESYLTLARWSDDPGRTSDWAGPPRTTARSSSARPTCSPPTTTCGAGTPTGSGARAPSGCTAGRSGACGRGGGGAATSTTGWSASTAGWGSPPGRTADTAYAGSGWSRTSRCPSRASRVSSPGSTRPSACVRCGCAPCACASPRTRQCPHLAELPAHARCDVRQRRVLGTVLLAPGERDGDRNRAIETEVDRVGGKSLYSDAFYDEATFASLYGTDHLDRLRAELDPEGRLPSLYDKAVRRR